MGILYQRYKLAFWVILSLLFASGMISNFFTGSMFEVILNGVLFFICLIIAITLIFQSINNGKKKKHG
ncbi:hypothetical protein [Ureibacillus acetophenoni]